MPLSKLLRRKAYGLDISGEVVEGGQKNIEDTAEPYTNNETPVNPANINRDYEAEKEFPELLERRSSAHITRLPRSCGVFHSH